MGQGRYDVLGWGILETITDVGFLLEDLEENHTIPEGLRRQIHHGYETEPVYTLVRLAVSDPWLQEYWDLPDLPLDAPRVRYRSARMVTIPGYQMPHETKDLWNTYASWCRNLGAFVPDPSLILANDYD